MAGTSEDPLGAAERLSTRLTERFGLTHPIVSAPMAFAGGGRLAAAVTHAGGLGLIGGGYGDGDWLEREFAAAGNARIGCGFITWSAMKKPELVDQALSHEPAALMLSFGDPAPFAGKAREAGVPVICQVQTLAHARDAIRAGAAVIVAQGSEAGGHGARRGTVTLVPEVADLLAREAPDTLLLAAGGIADGRGLAAALMLGADGVLIGSRFWASAEALVAPGFHAAALEADGDGTVRQTLTDIVRLYAWPEEFDARVLDRGFVRTWRGREAELAAAAPALNAGYVAAVGAGDVEQAGAFVGEAVGLIRDIRPAAEIIETMVAEAARHLRRGAGLVG